MTNEMEAEIQKILATLEGGAGIVAAVREGRVQAEVNRGAWERERKVESGEVKKVGVNCFVEEEEERAVELHPYREEEAEKQVQRLRRVKETRDAKAVETALGRLRAVAAAKENVMAATMEAVEAYATVGEICGVFRQVYGEFKEPVSSWR
jgi:methylmalonyl-CoA mutase N-terminal domain/subunit